jgi:hypothetical protein
LRHNRRFSFVFVLQFEPTLLSKEEEEEEEEEKTRMSNKAQRTWSPIFRARFCFATPK